MNSFYGGSPGRSFTIDWIFQSRYGEGNSIEEDLKMGWKSPIAVDSFVVVSYGTASDSTYDSLFLKDIELSGKSYNSTLWQKSYDESQETNNGLYYRLIMSMTGNTPHIQVGETVSLNADQMPDVKLDNSEIDKPILTFELPQSQILQNPKLKVLDPEVNPSIVLDSSDINKPRYDFSIPRAVKFYYGEFLGERTSSKGTYELADVSFGKYGVGDYYINAPTGFIYKVIQKVGNVCTFQYIACLQSPLPSITTTPVSPYTEGVQTNPKVIKTLTNNQGTAWNLEFKIPKVPKLDIETKIIGAIEKSKAVSELEDDDTVIFKLDIPGGSQIQAGMEITEDNVNSVALDTQKPGDVYINTRTGYVYILDKDNKWIKQQDSLKGPVGEALNIVNSYETTEEDTLENGIALIFENDPSPQDLFAVTFTNTALDTRKSYWYFKDIDKKWGRVLVTGDITSMIGGSGDPDKTAYSKNQIIELLSWGIWKREETK